MPLRRDEPTFPVEPVTIQTIKRIKGTMNHSYRDFSQVPPAADYVPPSKIEDMTFAQRVHDMLSRPELYGDYIAWMPHGRAFKVLKPQQFEKHVCPVYFGHRRYSSFLRSLNNYGLKHFSRGIDRNCYYHEFMLRGKFHLCQYMPPKRDARRLVSDPTNELDFYRLSERYPLPTREEVDNRIPRSIVVSPPDSVDGLSISSQGYNPAPSLPISLPSMSEASHTLPSLPVVPTTAAVPNHHQTEQLVLQLLMQQQPSQFGTLPTPPAPAAPQPSTSAARADVAAATILKLLLQQQQQQSQQPKFALPASANSVLPTHAPSSSAPSTATATNTTTTTTTTATLDELVMWSSASPPTVALQGGNNNDNPLTNVAVALLLQQLLSSRQP